MKKMFLLFPLVLLLLLTVTVISCEKTSNVIDEQASSISLSADEFQSFTIGQSPEQVKENFFELSGEEQLLLWKQKIDQLLTLPLPIAHIELINELRDELNSVNDHASLITSDSFKIIGIGLANITPEEDFLMMFTMLDAYQYSGSFIGTGTCINCIADLINAEGNGGVIENPTLLARRPTCNCKWSCWMLEWIYHGTTTSNCNQTLSGCGFLWTTPCTHYYAD